MIKIPSLIPGNKDLCVEWSRKCMMTNMKSVLFTDDLRASPNNSDGLSKGRVFNGDDCAVGILCQQIGSVLVIWGRMIRNACIARAWRNQSSHSLVIFSWHNWSRSFFCLIIFISSGNSVPQLWEGGVKASKISDKFVVKFHSFYFLIIYMTKFLDSDWLRGVQF